MKSNIIIDPSHKESYILYARKSTDDALNQKNSIDYQIGEGLQFSKRLNLTIANLTIPGFCENGIIKERHSGYKQDKNFEILENNYISQKVERPKFLMLITLLKRKAIKGVVCLCWDRISRNENDDMLVKKLISAGIEFKFIQVTYDKTSSGALHMDIDGMFSRHYSRMMSEKISNATRKLKSEGICTYPAPIGYINQGPREKVLDPQRANLVKSLFELYSTGEWGLNELTHWAVKNSLSCRPRRKPRTIEEQLNDVELESLPKVSRPISKRSVEHILKNQFYIGRIKDRDVYIPGTHPALIDHSLFFKVQNILQKKCNMKNKIHFDYFIYRGCIKCIYCNRYYSPYEQKGINYLMLKCRAGCLNKQLNVGESDITNAIINLLVKLPFTDQELQDIDIIAYDQLNKMTDKRNNEMNNINSKLNKAQKDLDYLRTEKISLLRNNLMSAEEIKSEEFRLNNECEKYQETIKESSASYKSMLDYVIQFSELIKSVSIYFEYALDNDKREIVNQIFSELFFSHSGLQYVAKEGFSELFLRNDKEIAPFGAAFYLFSELDKIYFNIKNIKIKF